MSLRGNKVFWFLIEQSRAILFYSSQCYNTAWDFCPNFSVAYCRTFMNKNCACSFFDNVYDALLSTLPSSIHGTDSCAKCHNAFIGCRWNRVINTTWDPCCFMSVFSQQFALGAKCLMHSTVWIVCQQDAERCCQFDFLYLFIGNIWGFFSQ